MDQDTVSVSMDVTSLYVKIPQEEGIEVVCKGYEKFHNNNPPIPTNTFLKQNPWFNPKGEFVPCKWNDFMAEIETRIRIQQSNTSPRVWERYVGDIFSLWDSNIQEVNLFIDQANRLHPTIKLTAKVSENKITFLDTVVFKGERFKSESILDIKTHYKPTETLPYTHFTSCHSPGVNRGFIKGAIRLPKTNSKKQHLKSASLTSNYALKRVDIQKQS